MWIGLLYEVCIFVCFVPVGQTHDHLHLQFHPQSHLRHHLLNNLSVNNGNYHRDGVGHIRYVRRGVDNWMGSDMSTNMSDMESISPGLSLLDNLSSLG